MNEELSPQVRKILNGKNENVQKVERLLAEPLMKMVTESTGKTGEEKAGVMNFWYMEISTLLRKAAAIGYTEGILNYKEELASQPPIKDKLQ